MTKPTSNQIDSKGAAIEKILWELYNATPHQISSDVPKAKQAILSLLAQEVNKARKDELTEIVGGYHRGAKFQFAGTDPIYTYIKDRIKDLERLG